MEKVVVSFCSTSDPALLKNTIEKHSYETCCKRRQPPSPLATPFAGSNTMRFLSLGFVKDSVYVPPLPMSLKEFRGRITHALQNITADMLHRVWDEFDYRVDVCRVTQGAHSEGL